jgi:DNA-binding transcriptional LysR family regulator
VNWFEEANVSPGLVHRCNSFSVVASLVRRGVGVSLLPPDLFIDDLESRNLKILIEEPRSLKVDYSAAYLPGIELSILPEVAALAREESWFLGSTPSRGKGFATEMLVSSQHGL